MNSGGLLYGLVGEVLTHSYSVPLHNMLGNGRYNLFELAPRELADFFKRTDIGGINVTMPYKKEALKHCTELSEEASRIGAVNTVVFRGSSRIGYNTDAFGFLAMAKAAGIGFNNKRVVILGSGGAALTAKYVVEKEGGEVRQVSREGKLNYGNLKLASDAEIIVNATPVGMFPKNGKSPIALSSFPKCEGVLDMIYNPLETALVLEARSQSIKAAGGLAMLAAQGAAAEELFFDKRIPEEETRRAYRALLLKSRSIVLIGMPGSGKSTVGAALAELTGRRLYDTDNMVEEAAGMTVPEIFANCGEEGFRKLEAQAARRAGSMSGAIIATGGGIVTREENYAALRQNGRIYEIKRDTALLETCGRPLSARDGLFRLYRERAPLYQKWADAVAVNDGSPYDTAKAIWEDMKNA